MNTIMTGTFIDEFTEWIEEYMVNDKNLVITGDFNVHINDQEDPEVQILSNITSALCLNQHIKFSTHRAGNTLDLLFTETSHKVNVLQCDTFYWGEPHSMSSYQDSRSDTNNKPMDLY